MGISNLQLSIAVGSTNPMKVAAAERAFKAMFKTDAVSVHSCKVSSGVSAQPMSEEETELGALQRVRHLITETSADFYVGIEGGIKRWRDKAYTFAVLVVAEVNTSEVQWSVNQSAMLPLPRSVVTKLEQGQELGDVMDSLFAKQNIKHSGGALGQLTDGVLTREDAYYSALCFNLVRFTKRNLFRSP